MRQARAAMRSGAATSRAAAKEHIQSAHSKWQPGLSPLEEEEKLKVIVPTNAQQLRQINTMIDTLMQDGGLDPDVRKGLAMWKVNYQMESVPDQVRRAFLEGFWCWLLGRGTDEDTKRTLWGRANVAAHNSEVAAYLETFARKRTEYAARLILMAEHVPDTLVGFYLYYKYITKGALKKVQDHTDPQKWFYSLSDEQFLEDWDLFEQEGGNYAHMIEPAAKRSADKQPFGGDEENTIPTDPYPAQPSDRNFVACMDNLAQQIRDLNQSLSLSHADENTTTMLRAMSRTKSQTNPTSIAAAGSDMTQATEIMEEEEYDPDGGDGNDEDAQLDQSVVIAEKLSESIAASRELTNSIRELIAEERARMQPPKEKEEESFQKEASTPVAMAHGEVQDRTFEGLENLHSSATMAALGIGQTPDTVIATPSPMQKTQDTVQITPMTTPEDPTTPQFQKNLEETRNWIMAMGDDWQERVKNSELSRLEARAAELKTIKNDWMREREHAKSMAEAEAADQHRHARIDALMQDDAYKRRAVQIAGAERQQRDVQRQNSSSEDITIGALVAQKQTARKLAGELGSADSEGSSADILETSKDRAMIDDAPIESSASESAHEETNTISDASALADSLVEQASSDSYDPGSAEKAKDALAAQRIATRASKRKEEELKKKVQFSGATKQI